MPIVIVETVKLNNGWTKNKLYISLREVYRIFPIEKDKHLELLIVEIKDENDKLVKRFKPLKEFVTKLDHYRDYGNIVNDYVPCIRFEDSEALRLGIGIGYKVAMVLVKYAGNPIFPFELKTVGLEAEKIVEGFSRIEASLLTITLEHSVLNKALGYVYDAYRRLDENDIEGARTALRNALDILKDDFVVKIQVGSEEESEQLPAKLRKLIDGIRGLLHYGGPHPGPAPRTTTEMAISLTIELLQYFCKSNKRRNYSVF